ncbi:transposase [Mannheimia indoligenes]|uniref:transposase n=1 Tax=Mannheimia indoligenes TaxID=3103145 RepID=UPI002FE599DC
MAGLKILCPFCGKPTKIRSSERPSAEITIAYVSCHYCGEFQGKFMGELVDIKKAVFIDYKDDQQWGKNRRVNRRKENSKARKPF